MERWIIAGFLWLLFFNFLFFWIKNRRARAKILAEVARLPLSKFQDTNRPIFSLPIPAQSVHWLSAAATLRGLVLVTITLALLTLIASMVVLFTDLLLSIGCLLPIILLLFLLADSVKDSLGEDLSLKKLLHRHQGLQFLQVSSEGLLVPVLAMHFPLICIAADRLAVAVPLSEVVKVRWLRVAQGRSTSRILSIQTKMFSEIAIDAAVIKDRECDFISALRQGAPEHAFSELEL